MKQAIIFSFLGLLLSSCVTQTLVVNKGISGNTSSDLWRRIEVDVIEERPDLVILMVGTNDMLNSKKMISYQEYASNLSMIVRRLKYDKIEVLLVSPPTVDSTYLFERHDKKLFTESPNKKLETVSLIMEEISSKENAWFLDINRSFRALSLPQHNRDEFIKNENNSGRRDGVHLTAKGYSFISEQIFEYLKNKANLHKGIKVICFGDSLTFGSGVEGSGTVKSDTYPAYLLKKLKEL